MVLKSSRDAGSRNTRRPSKSGLPAARAARPFRKNDRSQGFSRVESRVACDTEKTNLRALCAVVLMEVLDKGAKLKAKLDQRQKTVSRESDKALMKEIVSGCLRNLPVIDLSIKEFLKKGIEETDPFILSLLRVGCYQLLYLDRIPAYAAVNECVNAAKAAGMDKTSGFLNIVLRNISTHKEALLALQYRYAPPLSLCYKYGMPPWLIERYLGRFGPEEGELILESMNDPSHNSIVFFSGRDYISAKPVLDREGFQLEENSLFPLTFWVKGKNPADSGAFAGGLFYICDPASQLPAVILPPTDDGCILDLCAAPGTKSLILAKKMDKKGFVAASDISVKRIRLLVENMKRFGTRNIFPLLADVEKELPFRGEMDSCILDAPCSSMGTIKRAPELRWQATKERFRIEGGRQLQMLLNASRVIKEGGHLLYSVCSIEEEETTAVVEAFLEERGDFSGEKIKVQGGLKDVLSFTNAYSAYLLPHRHKGDGFFAALLRRKSGRKNRI